MALRLKYANLPISKIKICPVQKRAVKEVLSGTGKTAFLLTTYTALWPTEKFLVKIAQKERIYEAERVPSVS
jgi:hypothetical protein